MTKSELVSVIIPLYNAEKYVRKTIDSILKQTFSNLHIYVIDDFSTDRSPEIVMEICERDSRISYHKMPRKAGCPAPTKNVGVKLAKGEYVAFSDHDDWWHPEKIEMQLKFFSEHPSVKLLGCNVEIIDTENDRSFGNFWENPTTFCAKEIRQLALAGPIFATTSCMMGRRDFLLEHPFDENLLGSDEYDLSLHTALDDAQAIGFVPQTLAYWRWHSTSLSHSPEAAKRALSDEQYFSAKLLKRSDLSDFERKLVVQRLAMVTRRAGNAALAHGDVAGAKDHYQTAVKNGDRVSRMLLLASSLLPRLTQRIVQTKRAHSHATPTFR